MSQKIPNNPSLPMKILILNWRDIKNPSSGGAEILTHELARRWVGLGCEVTQFSSSFQGAKKMETINGVRIIRKGAWWTVHILAFFYYLKDFRTKTDIVIDEVHWFPFFSLLYVQQKVILLVCEVATDLFSKSFPLYLSVPFQLLEKIYFHLYKNVSTLAISKSTKEDLIKRGFSKNSITVLPMGITLPQEIKIFPKEKDETLIFVGRLTKLKGAEDALSVLKLVKKDFPKSKLWIVGRGEDNYVKRLRRSAKNLGVIDSVIFYDFVSEEKKFSLMSRAHILLVPSVHEGWGLTVHEAGIVGTPAIAYNVGGLRDIIKNGENGICAKSHPQGMANQVKELLSNRNLYIKFRQHATDYAKKMNWDDTAKEGLKIIKNCLR